MTTESTWHLGYIIGLPIIAFLALASLGVAVAGFISWLRERRKSSYYHGDGGFVAGLFGSIGAVLVAGLVIAAFPFDTSYHRYYRVSGEVEQVQHRLIKAGDGMAERYVFVIDGKPYAVDDTRATLTKKGDHVSLWCSKEYQYMGDSGWACEWGVAR